MRKMPLGRIYLNELAVWGFWSSVLGLIFTWPAFDVHNLAAALADMGLRACPMNRRGPFQESSMETSKILSPMGPST